MRAGVVRGKKENYQCDPLVLNLEVTRQIKSNTALASETAGCESERWWGGRGGRDGEGEEREIVTVYKGEGRGCGC